MIQIQVIRDSADYVIERLSVKNVDAKKIVSDILEIDASRRNTQKELDTFLNEANVLAKQVGELMKSGKKAEADDLKNKSASLKESSKRLGDQLTILEKQ